MNKPRVRFKGYTEDWEQRKLSDIVDILDGDRGKNYPTSDDFNDRGHTLFLNASNVTNGGFLFQDNHFITEEKSNSMSNGKLEEDDIVITSRGSLGHIAWYNTDISRLVPYARINSGMLILRNKQEVKTEYIYHFMKSDKGQSQISIMSFGSVQPQLTKKGVENLKVVLPPKSDEQLKLGIYFTNLDHLITLHQRKCDQTRKLKKYMLQNMFPQNGSNVPKIRFNGFTNAWEQRKAVNIAEYSKGNGYSKSDLTESGTPIILYGRLYTKYQFVINEVDTFAIPKAGAVYSQGNEVIIPASGETAEEIARASAVEKPGVLLGGDLNILRPFNFINPSFLALAISSGEPQKELAKRAQGKSVVHIHNSDIQGMVISYPTKIEQDQIVAVFRHLDHLITLHQQKCEELQNIKKFMLQNMFVPVGE